MRFFYACICVLAYAASISASPPIPGGPYKVTVGDVTEIEITEASEGTLGFHNPYDIGDLFIREATPRRKGTVSYIVQPKRAAIYRLAVWTVGEKNGATLIIDSTGNNPRPNPQPEPDPVPPRPVPPKPDPPTPDPPKPDPLPPITNDHWFIVIEETEDRTPEITQLLDFRKWDTLGIHYRFYDDDSPDVSRLGYDRLLTRFNIKVPVLFVFDKDGNIVSAQELPTTFDAIKKIRDGTVGPRGHSVDFKHVPTPTVVYPNEIQQRVFVPRQVPIGELQNCVA